MKKLRIVNTVGSVIFMIYALIIHSYPTAVMNFCLVAINLYFLWKMSKTEKVYDLTSVRSNDVYLKYLIDKYGDDMRATFPGVDLDTSKINRAFIISCEGKPVGITIGKSDSNEIELLLDYTIPEFRDFSIGRFLLGRLKSDGIETVIYRGPDQNHRKYLDHVGFVKTEQGYIRKLY